MRLVLAPTGLRFVQGRSDLFACSLEVQSLVGSQESEEHGHGLDTDAALLVHVEVSPGSGEVGLEVLSTSLTLQTLVGGEDLGGGSAGSGLGDGEDTSGLALLGVLVAEATLIGVVHDHGLHEEVVGAGGEVLGGIALVLLVEES